MELRILRQRYAGSQRLFVCNLWPETRTTEVLIELLQKCGQCGQASKTQRMAFLQQALSTAATYGSAVSHAQCTVALCDAIQEQVESIQLRATQEDPRSQLEHVLTLLTDTEQRLAAFAPMAVPMDSPVETVHPIQVLHARILARLARTHELHAWADVKLSEQDRLRIRGSFPRVQPPQSTSVEDANDRDSEQLQTPAVPASVVENFLDSTEKAALEEQGAASMIQTPHELYAATYATSAETICKMGPVTVECNLVKGALPMLLAEKDAIKERLEQAQMISGSAKTSECNLESFTKTGLQQKGITLQPEVSQPLVKEAGNDFSSAQDTLFDALSGAVNLKDWDLAVRAAQSLMHLALQTITLHATSEDVQGIRKPAEALAVWQSCRAMLEDSRALMSYAPQHHTARVVKRLLELRKHPVHADVEHWCSDMEAADALRPEHDTLMQSWSVTVPQATDEPLDGDNAALPEDVPEFKGLKSKFINFRAAAKMLQPVSTLLQSFPSHVSILILDLDESSSTVHACSIRKPVEESQPSPNSEYCQAVIDARALETLLKRLHHWKGALARQSQHSDGPQEAQDAPEEGVDGPALLGESVNPSGTPEATAVRQTQDENGENTQAFDNAVVDEANVTGEEDKASNKGAELDLRKEWHSMVTDMDQLFDGFTKLFAHAVAPPPASSAPPVAEKGKKGAPAPPPAKEATTVLLCVGGTVSDLPLEALAGLQPAAAVCRDRGMHFSVARSELAGGSSDSGDSLSLQPVSIEKAAFGVSAELESQFCSALQQQYGPEWEGDVYRSDRTVAQEHHMALALEHEVLISALTNEFSSTVHDSTVCCMGLEDTKVVVIMEQLKPVMDAAAGTLASEAAPGEVQTETCAELSVRSKVLDSSQGLSFESRMCMLLQRGASCCVSNRWTLPSDVGFGTLAAAFKEQDTDFPVAARNASEALGASEPWHKYSFVFYGVPTVVVKGGTDAVQKGKKK